MLAGSRYLLSVASWLCSPGRHAIEGIISITYILYVYVRLKT